MNYGFENTFMRTVEEMREKELCIADGLVVVAKAHCDNCNGSGVTEAKQETVQNGHTYITFNTAQCECVKVHPRSNVQGKYEPVKTIVRVKA
jgi:hypothetical protein